VKGRKQESHDTVSNLVVTNVSISTFTNLLSGLIFY